MPGEMQAAAEMLKVLFGKGVGTQAPAFQPGQSQGVGGGLLDPLASQTPPMSGLNMMNQVGGAIDMIGGMGQQEAPKPEVLPDPSLDQSSGDPVADSFKQSSLADIDDGPDKRGNPFSGFLGGLDKGLQSPAQLLGLGLLGQLGGNDNRLPLTGLLAMGLLNRNK